MEAASTMEIGAALSLARTPVWRVPVTMTSDRVSFEVSALLDSSALGCGWSPRAMD
jgi:hypothetical protein